MEKDGERRENTAHRSLARRLSHETGISEKQAADLIKLIGTDWNSLLREVRILQGH